MDLVVALTRQTPSFIVRQRLTVLAKFRIQKNSSLVQEVVLLSSGRGGYVIQSLREENSCFPQFWQHWLISDLGGRCKARNPFGILRYFFTWLLIKPERWTFSSLLTALKWTYGQGKKVGGISSILIPTADTECKWDPKTWHIAATWKVR